ncbi:dihydroflavonol-4-reductase [Exophiala aquamarina CBS 119918]|uniref:Dihydroflavonol-4-reductase n=1 Tax=Exophiala aquamarina CBS 119918 TaxID=1182545 RepID=A0A072PY22_9EURO|nr:dihydroflavonol-4-reductase [Exophiala aquamarina CBS 119918]KEF60510.1 dihydroflavonol-4-reductase [Exophiala aquamarina CBS 119918]
MGKILLTGGTGFVAAHILNELLANRHNVVTTVRSRAKGETVLGLHSGTSRTELSYEIVEDIAATGAFDDIFKRHPNFDAIIHAASPFHDNFHDPMELLDPAIKGTTGILKAAKSYAPSIKRVVLTSSFAAMVNEAQAPEVYDESCWNPVTWETSLTIRNQAYRGSKAKKAAWDFVQEQKPGFDLVTICPPVVYGPIAHNVGSVNALNTSNQRVLDFIQGKHREGDFPPTGTLMWVDVRDLAAAHVRALEVGGAGGQRFFSPASHYSNKMLVDAIRDTHPGLADKLPTDTVDELIDRKHMFNFDNSKIKEVLGIQFRQFKESIGATVSSLQELRPASTKSEL